MEGWVRKRTTAGPLTLRALRRNAARRAHALRGRGARDGGRHFRQRSDCALEHRVELAAAQGGEHRAVLVLHQRANELGDVRLLEVLSVFGARGLDDAPTVSEEVGHDARELDARIFSLDVKNPTAVADVVVETEYGRRHLGQRATNLSRAPATIQDTAIAVLRPGAASPRAAAIPGFY